MAHSSFLQKGLTPPVTPEPQAVSAVYSEVEPLSVKFRLPRGGCLHTEAQQWEERGGGCAAEGEAQPSLRPLPLNEATEPLQGPVSLCMKWGSSGSPCPPHGVIVETSTKGVHPLRVYQMHLPVLPHSLALCQQLRINFPRRATRLRCHRVGVGAQGLFPPSSALLAQAQLLAVCEGSL